MPFDQDTRNRLNRFVSDARSLLTDEFTNLLQQRYGMDPTSGSVSPMGVLNDLDDSQRETARILRVTLDYYHSENPDKKQTKKQVLNRILREQAFTVLNRLCALRLAEARGLILETIAKGYKSEGFLLYSTLAGPALGETMEAYQTYLFSLFDELALELPPLFDRFSPEGRLFPGQTVLQNLLDLINDPELDGLWSEDETIGWIYQYFNSQEERRAMRAASSAPRNSRELAVRNQFFTPRYVVEFLTDNTLGRLWFEMTRGQTALLESCNYLVRRKHTFFLEKGEEAPEPFDPLSTPIGDPDLPGDIWLPPNPDLDEIEYIFQYALTVGGYHYAIERLGIECGDLANNKLKAYQENGEWEGTFEELRCCLFFEQRRFHHFRRSPEGDEIEAIRDLYQTICKRWDYEVEFVPYRQLKDPRGIKMLDPACGSMHFGLYSFDLFEQIYAEAWEVEEENGEYALRRLVDLDSLHDTYPNEESLLLDVPRLIIKYNIHGIDIDPRAVQIAGLSLWLRAQKTWENWGISRELRPQINKSNVVCAEPMPGDSEMLKEFLQELDQENLKRMVLELLPSYKSVSLSITENMVQALRILVKEIWEAMTLAGEAGSLLKIEKIIKRSISEAQERSGADLPLLHALNFDLTASSDSIIDFWNYSENLVISALKLYAQQNNSRQHFQRRIFVNDSIQGFDFISIISQTYDCILMNPPFGNSSIDSFKYIDNEYKTWNRNLLCAFIERMSSISGVVGTVFDRTASIKTSYQKFRREILLDKVHIKTITDLGWNVLEANVEVSAAVLINGGKSQKEAFFNVNNFELAEKKNQLLEYCSLDDSNFNNENLHFCNPQSFIKLPNSIIGFEIPDFARKIFSKHNPLSDSSFVSFKGHDFKSDQHFRLFWEISIESLQSIEHSSWTWVFNGGEWSPYYHATRDVAPYGEKGQKINNHPNVLLRNLQYQLKPGIGYGKRGRFLDAQIIGKNHVYTAEGIGARVDLSDAFYFVGLLNSKLFQYIINLYCGQHKSSSYVNLFPYSPPSSEMREKISSAVKEIWTKKSIWQSGDETDVSFIIPRLLWFRGEKLDIILDKLNVWEESASDLILNNSNDINDFLFNIYRLRKSNKDKVNEYCQSMPPDTVWKDGPNKEPNKSIKHITDLLSFFVGTVFGRYAYMTINFNLDKITIPKPFHGPKANLPKWYENGDINYPKILISEKGNERNIEFLVRKVINYYWSDQAEKFEVEIIHKLNIESLSYYFQNLDCFFNDHYNKYSKNRRYAPIYWPLSTPSGSYTLWLYYHRINDQILFICVNDFVDPKLKQVNADIRYLQTKHNRSKADECSLEELTDLEIELKEFREELLRVAAFWKPNLDDGVEITASPLWRLFQHRSWQKRLKRTWERLEEGEYDWAHLAYSIWPERVKEKCKKDKSIAIAHDLEHLYQGE